MSTLDAPGRLSADDRYELASRASAHERRARPSHLVALGAIALMVSLIVLGLGWRAEKNATRALERAGSTSAQVDRLVAQIRTLEQAAAAPRGDDPFVPVPDLLSRLTQMGVQAGLQNEVPLPRSTAPRTEGSARLLTYPYTVRDVSLERVLAWIEMATERIPGLSVRELTLNPAPTSWVVKVTFTRYERIE